MQPTNDFGCYKPPAPTGTKGDVDPRGDAVDEVPPEMGVYLLARLRMHIVAAWFTDDGDAGTAVAA